MDACVITCALSGVAAGRDQCPAIPYTLTEYAAEAKRAYDAGAAVVHIHARYAQLQGRGVPSDHASHPRRGSRGHHQLLDRRGNVAEVNVAEGGTVQEGDVIAVID
jgi:hypothetical protein